MEERVRLRRPPLAVNDAIGVQQGAVATSTEYVAEGADSPVIYSR